MFSWVFNQLASKLILGISAKILRISINEMISNCLDTEVVNDRGRLTTKR